MKTRVLSALSDALNAYLKLDAESQFRLAKLQGKVITIELLPFSFIFQCVFSAERIDITMDSDLPPDTILRGTPLQLFNVMAIKADRQRFFADDVSIDGNAEIGQQVIALFDALHIDWEEYLSRLVGDVPAYHAGKMVKHFCAWLSSTDESITEDIKEYLQEETEWLPTREALQDLFHDIDTLRLDVERSAAKINLLASHSDKEKS